MKVKIELVYDPSIAEEYRREQAEKERKRMEEKARKKNIWTVTAIRNDEMGVFYYDAKYNTVDWRHPTGEEISLAPPDWKMLADAIPQILIQLGVYDQEWEKEV